MIIDSLQYNGECSCGREHSMETLLSVVESGCLKRIDEYLARFSLTGFKVAVYDENTYHAASDRHPCVDFEVVLKSENLHANEHGVAMLLQQLPENADILIAIGSGTIHDITRYCAYQKHLDFVSCPTAASVDGFCSSVAAMTWNGCKKTLTAVAPKLVLADLDIIRNAPVRLAKSGFGDMIGKYAALTDWKISHILTGEFYCKRIAEMTLKAAEAVVTSAKGIAGGEESSYENLMYGLLLSGLAMQMMGNSRPASGAEHHISHMIEMEPEGLPVHTDALHGEKVGVGTLLAVKEYQRLYHCGNIAFKDYEAFLADDVVKIFGKQMAAGILEENQHDAAANIQGVKIKNCWQEIRKEIEKLPDAEYLKDLYDSLGIKSTLADIQVSDELADPLLQYSPLARNRLTLMRLRRCF